MKMIAVLFLCVVVAVNANCPDVPGVGDMKAGEQKPVHGTCNIATCNADGTYSELTCPVGAARPPCKFVPGDKTKLYPDCCPKYWCPPKN
ncbi:venom peptide HsVx1-like isoform X2 [Diabrotica virgifera virgifera]|uniref:Single domain-containing protein n=1 Tax=Diabrotica virgifera virgifera TaxID=50390 RepID=A0ABM5JN45_DIAVI|nr:venom peptide HsVx1-like isoform X2 [Diabrotica virgifera virgifera]